MFVNIKQQFLNFTESNSALRCFQEVCCKLWAHRVIKTYSPNFLYIWVMCVLNDALLIYLASVCVK